MTIPAGTITITVQAMIIIVLISLAVEVHSMAVDLQEDGILVPVIQGAVTIQVQALHLTNPFYSMKTLQQYLEAECPVFEPLFADEATKVLGQDIIKAMKAAISEACREQREICAGKIFEWADDIKDRRSAIDVALSAPEPKF